MAKKREFDDRSSRIPMKIVIVMDDGSRSSMTFCRNLSSGGMFLECVEQPARGSLLKVEFVLPNNMRKISIEARVAWVRKSHEDGVNPGIGIKFEGLSEALKADIESAVSYLQTLSQGQSA